MAFTESMSDFINTDTPGHATCVIGAATVVGLFDNDSQDVFGIVAGTSPAVHVISGEIGTPAVGNAITVDGVSYTIIAIESDGHGVTTLRLKP